MQYVVVDINYEAARVRQELATYNSLRVSDEALYSPPRVSPVVEHLDLDVSESTVTPIKMQLNIV